MKQLIQTLTTLLQRVATNVHLETSLSDVLKETTASLIIGTLRNPIGKTIYLYIRKNQFNLVTDLEIVVTSSILQDDLAIALIKPDAFFTYEDLENQLDLALSRVIETLNENAAEYSNDSMQLELFPTEPRLLDPQTLTNREN